MNNTFCLSIFFALIYVQRLTWEFTAEVISIFCVEFVMGLMALKKVHTMFHGWMILAMFPGSLLLVWVLQNVVGIK